MVIMVSLTKNRQGYLFIILLLLIIYLLAGFYPFEFKSTSNIQLNNGVVSTSDEGLHFQLPGIAYTEDAPLWLPHAIATSSIEISLEVRTNNQEQGGPARIFTYSLNPFSRNLTVGQVGSDLIVRMRHGYTSLNGLPGYRIKEVFTDSEWHQIDVRITSSLLEVYVDGEILVTAPLPNQHLERWDHTYRLALGNELTGDRPWLGYIRKAVVHIGTKSIDYLLSDALCVPDTYTVVKNRAIKLVPFVREHYDRGSFVDWEINLLMFVPLGWLLVMFRRPRPSVFLAIILSAGVSAMIEITQLLFLFDRVPSTEDLILNTLGGGMGAWLAENFDFSIKRRTTKTP